MNRKIVLVTGGFDPIHSGHIEYFKAAKALGDILVVGVNSDDWLTRKKGKAFMPIGERLRVISHLKSVDHCIQFQDECDNASSAIDQVKMLYPNDSIIFANGGDRTLDNIPEMAVDGVEFAFGVGGSTKLNSSSWLLDEWKSPKTERPWGYYRVLYEVDGTKVKELTILPGKSLSMQRHKHREEYWHVAEGQCMVELILGKEYLPNIEKHCFTIEQNISFQIPIGDWHKLSNPYDVPCKIIEIQSGEICSEDDIERVDG
jgi:cytidyltransferase-like protein